MIHGIIAILTILTLAAGPVYAEERPDQKDMVFFDLAQHLHDLEGEPCTVCHIPGSLDIMPDLTICLECHEQELLDTVKFPPRKTHGTMWLYNHGKLAKMGMYKCTTCHEQQGCVACHKGGFPDELSEMNNNFINVHRADFKITHPIIAKTDPRLCVGCHEPQFCFDCHENFKDNDGLDLSFSSHKRSWRSITAFGKPHANFSEAECQNCHTDSVLPSHDWSRSHAREARRSLHVCQTCHPEGDTCLRCHSAISGLGVNPHPRDWDDMKDRLRSASNARTCRKCHKML